MADSGVPRAMWVFLLVLFCFVGGGAGQQPYNDGKNLNDNGYGCNATVGSSSCSTFAYYLVGSDNGTRTVEAVAALFGVSPENVTQANSRLSLLASGEIPAGQGLWVPVSCACSAIYGKGALLGWYYQGNVSYVIKGGDTYMNLANNTFQNLVTMNAIAVYNPDKVATDLEIGDGIEVPLRCACPSPAQEANRTKMLLTYVVQPEDELSTLAAEFNVVIADLAAANELAVSAELYYGTTLLLPVAALPFLPQAPVEVAAPPPAGGGVGEEGKGTKSKAGIVGGVAAGVGLLLVVVGVLGVLWVLRTRRRKEVGGKYDGDFESLPSARSQATGGSDGKSGLAGDVLLAMSDMVGADRPTLFSFEEVKEATGNFSSEHRVQGSVFRGNLHGNIVAIKQMKGNMTQELKILFQVHHSSLVKLLGLCSDEGSEHVYLVYEFAENGSLADCLRRHVPAAQRGDGGHEGSSAAFLSWNSRLQIALDVATGLEYIHEYINPPFVHKDIKSSNILLDAKLHAKIANFGMARSGVQEAMLTRHIAGTYGYMPPEYLQHGLISTKIDVFAFGVVVLELLSGQEAVVRKTRGQEEREVCLADMIGPILDGEDALHKLQAWMDPVLGTAYPLETAHKVAVLARCCVEHDPHKRPSMKDVTFTLSKLLGTSLEWECSGVIGLPLLTAESVEGR